MPIFDQGYQHWNGKLASQLWRWWAITRHGVRMQFRSKLTRLCIISCFGPALGLAAFIILWSLFEQGNSYIKPLIAMILPKELLDVPEEYRLAIWTLAYHFFFMIQFFLLMILVLLVGPGLISKDLRFNALPLYLSRPIRRWEYFLGKLGVISFFVLMVTAVPAAFAWLLGVIFSLKLSIIVDVLPILWGSLLVSLMVAVVYGLWMLALSSLSRNSRYVSMMWFGWWLLTGSLSVMLFVASRFEEWSHVASFTTNVQRMEEAIMGTDQAWLKIDEGVKLAREVAMKAGGARIPGIPGLPGGGSGRTPRVNPNRPENNMVLTQMVPTGNGTFAIRSSSVRHLYPWTWSALALTVMGVLSLCILMFRVKSLDRLRLIRFDNVSKWYGNVIGINNITLSIGPGVTGLLGPNGAGKSTFLQLVTGQLKPSKGDVIILGQRPWNNPWLYKHIGLCPEQDAFYEWMTGWQFVHAFAKLRGFSGSAARDAAQQAIERVSLAEAQHRRIGGYSRGMRQRIKVAQALVHQPKVLFLDEPFTGTDPVARRQLMDIIHKLADEGKSIVLSSHVLHEVQGLTQQIILIHRGRLVAEGNLRDIRDMIDDHPHRIVLHSEKIRDLAAHLVSHPDVLGLTVNDGEKLMIAETKQPDLFYSRLPTLLKDKSISVSEIYSEDDNLEAVFKYLTN